MPSNGMKKDMPRCLRQETLNIIINIILHNIISKSEPKLYEYRIYDIDILFGYRDDTLFIKIIILTMIVI